MPRILNPFHGTDPIAQTIDQLGRQMFGGTLDRDLKSEQLRGAQRTNAETDNLMNLVSNGGAAKLANSPIAQAMIIGSGYKPQDFGDLGLLESAATHGAAAPQTQNFQVGTGQPYDNTADAFNVRAAEATRANDLASADRRYSVDNALVEAIVNGTPQYARNVDAPGMQPVLSNTEVQGTQAMNNFGQMGDLPPSEQAYLGADVATGSKTPRNYVTADGKVLITYDGVNDAQSGMPLPAGGYIAGVEGNAKDTGVTNAVTTDLQSNVIAADSFIQTADAMLQLTEKPENFGLVGWARGNLQEAAQAGQAVMGMFGGEQKVVDTAAQVRAELDANGMGGLIPDLYDPQLPAIDMLGGVMLYQGASVLAGQENRSVSDKDIALMKQIIGEPKGWFESAESIKTKLKIAKAMAQNHKTLAQKYLDQGMAIPEGLAETALSQAIAQVTGSAGQPNIPAPAAAPEVVGGDVPEGATATGPNGEKIVLRGGQWVPL